MHRPRKTNELWGGARGVGGIRERGRDEGTGWNRTGQDGMYGAARTKNSSVVTHRVPLAEFILFPD